MEVAYEDYILIYWYFSCSRISGCATSNQNTSDYGNSNIPSKGSSVSLKGNQAPNVRLKNINGNGTFIGKKPLIINSWASWCHPCQVETPHLVKVYNKYKNQIQFIGVNLTSMDTFSNAPKFVAKYKIPFPELADTSGLFANKYGIIGEPTTFFVSRSGKVVGVHLGELTNGKLKKLIHKLLLS